MREKSIPAMWSCVSREDRVQVAVGELEHEHEGVAHSLGFALLSIAGFQQKQWYSSANKCPARGTTTRTADNSLEIGAGTRTVDLLCNTLRQLAREAAL